MQIIQFLIEHGGPVLFAAVLLNQLGLPIPAVPLLLASGALAAHHQLNPFLVLSVALLACFIADSIWFYLGRRGGNRVLKLLCRISLEPDSCIRRTRNIFDRFGMRLVLVAKFMPGLSAVVSPMAGSSGVSFLRYLAFDFVGSLLYVAAYTLLGALFRNQLEVMIATIEELGKSSFLLVGSLLAIYIAFKVFERHRLIRKWRVARITAEELRKKQTEGEPLMILDLRPGSELEKDPFVILGALRMAMEEVELREHEIPRDREVIVYCSCPNEISSARVASLLHRRGIVNVRPLLGGIDAWRERHYPTDRLSPAPAVIETR